METGESSETREIIDRFFACLAERDRNGLVALLAPDFTVVYHAGEDAFPWSGTFDGLEGFDRFLAVIAEHLEIVRVDRTAVVTDDDRVVVQSAGHWRVKANGADVRGGMINLFTVVDGRIGRYEVHADTLAFRTALDA